MKKTTNKQWILLAGTLLLAGGCQNTVNSLENAEKSARPNIVNDKRYITDGFLKDRLVLRSVKMTPATGGNMMVEISATNVRTGAFAQAWSGLTGDSPYSIAYKFIWQDENGMTVETPLSIWNTKKIYPGETVFFKAVAPNSRCKDFILNIKETK